MEAEVQRTTTETTGRVSLLPFAAASAAACALGFGLALLASGPERAAALLAAGAAALSAAFALSGLALLIDHGTNGLLAGFAVGFLLRGVLVAAGLFASGARGRAALIYALVFFALYGATQLVEVLYVWAWSRGSKAPENLARPAEGVK